jgi:endonuclease/exonuclease/phosphatase family metal-dependent hydrolase
MKWIRRIGLIIAIPAVLFGLFLAWSTIEDFRPEPEVRLEKSASGRQITATDTVFSIVSWNIGYFGLGKNSDFFFDGGKMTRPVKEDYESYSGSALKYIENTVEADFYIFQEVDFNSRRSYRDNQISRLQGVLPGMESLSAINYLVRFVPVPLKNPLGKVKSGLVTFSRFETSENTRYGFPGGYDWPVRLFQLDRCFLLSRLALPSGKELVLINTHNEAFDDGSQRAQQMAVLKEKMLAEYAKGSFVIVGGDWNQNPVGFGDWGIWGLEDLGIGRFSNDDLGRTIEPAIEPDFFPEGWQWVFDPELPTNRDVDDVYVKGKTKTTIIDFFVVSPNVTVLEVKTTDLGFEWADHQPVRMKFMAGD